MSLLHFTDILKKAGLDPARVKLIRHSLSDKDFAKCYYAGPQMVWEYTRIQKPNFSKDYDYWCVFISGKSTTARLSAIRSTAPSRPRPTSNRQIFRWRDALKETFPILIWNPWTVCGNLSIGW